jgi:FHA domain
MDLLDVAILGLRLALVATLYAFLLLVMRFAARSLRPAPAPKDVGLQLIVVDAGGSTLRQGEVIDVFDGTTLGRTADAGIVIADPAVSGQHARFARAQKDRTWMVSDLGSTNGTMLNAVPVTATTPLVVGDILTVGSVSFKIGAR